MRGNGLRQPRQLFLGGLLLAFAALSLLVIASPEADADTDDTSGHTDWGGWELDWEISNLHDGVSLQNVSYNGKQVLARASLPVMRVYYDRRCGPYSDRLGGTTYPISWADNRKVAHRSYTANGREWLEIGIYDVIGAYQIYQAWYLSSDGILDAHIFSSALQCNIDHRHYPYWRLDFDLGGPEGDRIQAFEGGTWRTVAREFDGSPGSRYRIVDEDEGISVEVLPGPGDWQIPASETDPSEEPAAVFGRVLASVPAADYESMYSVGVEGLERPRSADASIDGADVVVVYRSLMPHLASEGPELWHSSGPRFVVSTDAAENGSPIAQLEVSPTEGEAPLGVSLDAGGSVDPDDDALTYSWNFGEGAGWQELGPSVTHTYEQPGQYTAELKVSDGQLADQESQVISVVERDARENGPKLFIDSVESVGSSWQSVAFPHEYVAPVVIAVPEYHGADDPAVVRIRNVSANGFDLRVQNPGGTSLSGYRVRYLVAEEGAWSDGDGLRMEAGTLVSTRTDRKGYWRGHSLSPDLSFDDPVVLGQVMSVNDEDWSVFWSRGAHRTLTPGNDSIRVGKHVGEDNDRSRRAEILGYVVLEAGPLVIDGRSYLAGVSGDMFRGMGNRRNQYAAFEYEVSNVVLSQAGMDGGNGGWVVLNGLESAHRSVLTASIDEDQIKDAERRHTTEQAGYLLELRP